MAELAYQKILKTLVNHPAKYNKFLKFNTPKKRPYGWGNKICIRCGRRGSHISVHGLNYCRECFREIYTELGFKKYGKEI
jgi:small subunit ribosomal protein S14